MLATVTAPGPQLLDESPATGRGNRQPRGPRLWITPGGQGSVANAPQAGAVLVNGEDAGS